MTRRRKPSDEEQRLTGESWRSQMTPECESVPALIWKRVHRRFRIDLADARQATAAQVYELLHPLVGYDRITREMLAELVDKRVAGIFGLEGK
jgi:hypothetical protein